MSMEKFESWNDILIFEEFWLIFHESYCQAISRVIVTIVDINIYNPSFSYRIYTLTRLLEFVDEKKKRGKSDTDSLDGYCSKCFHGRDVSQRDYEKAVNVISLDSHAHKYTERNQLSATM